MSPRALRPAAVFAAALALWAAATAFGWVNQLVLPSPLAVVHLFWSEPRLIAANAGVTAVEALAGLALGNAVGLLLAIVFVGSAPARRAVLPLAMGAQAIPIVAVTPVLIIAFGNGLEPKILVAAFLGFFPMLVNAMRGLRSADAEVGDLMHSLSASAWQRLWMVRLPASLPFLFSALKLSACSAFVAAIVAEWVASDRGLGHLIVLAGSQFRADEVWAAVLVSAALSLAAVAVVIALERRATPWLRRDGRSAP